MIVNKCLASCLFEKCLKTVTIQQIRTLNRSRIGNRDWVAFGRSGNAYYYDEHLFPFPAVRFRENTNELLALREKEKGDWKKLTIEEKRILYRASFRQTFAEFSAPTGEWKSILGCSLLAVSAGLWLYIFLSLLIYRPKPHTFSEEYRKATLRRLLDMKSGFIGGVSSKWDYENDDWKK